MSSLRYKVQTKMVDNVDYTIYNPSSINWRTFKWQQGYYKHFVSSEEVYRFYLVSLNYYGTDIYSDIILILNNVEYDFDLYPGAEIWIPKLAEIKKYILDNQQ